ncbi:thioredoxin-like 1-2 [Scenedesmus sp. PABB004]|nr:thioredoxin-like 1-2 [Scenedesmus sp. PABB004]
MLGAACGAPALARRGAPRDASPLSAPSARRGALRSSRTVAAAPPGSAVQTLSEAPPSPAAALAAENAARRAAYEAQVAAQLQAERSGLPWWEVDCPANMVSVASLDELQARVEGECAAGRLVVVNFFAPECYACKSMQPKLRQIARDNPAAVFVKVNGLVGDLQAYCEDMGITRIPFFHFYRANKRVAAFSANMRPERLALLRAEILAQTEAAAATAAAAAGAAAR